MKLCYYYIFIIINVFTFCECDVNYSWKTNYIDVPIDHFRWAY